MYQLKLCRGRSYTGLGISATAGNPIVELESKGLVDALVAGGYFTLEGEIPHANSPNVDDKPVDKMTEKELDAYAAENGIDLTGLSKKAEKLSKIQQEIEDGTGVDFDEYE